MSSDFLLRLSIVLGILAIYYIWRAYRWRRLCADQRPPNSIVLLLAQHAPLNPQYLSIVVSRALGREVPAEDLGKEPDPHEVGDCVMGAAPHFMVSIDRKMFLVHSVPAPYVDPADFSESYRELRTKASLVAHTAWLSVDFLGGESTAADHRVMGRVAAEFVGPNCLALYHPGTDQFIPVEANTFEEFQEKLRGDDPVAELFVATVQGLVPRQSERAKI